MYPNSKPHTHPRQSRAEREESRLVKSKGFIPRLMTRAERRNADHSTWGRWRGAVRHRQGNVFHQTVAASVPRREWRPDAIRIAKKLRTQRLKLERGA